MRFELFFVIGFAAVAAYAVEPVPSGNSLSPDDIVQAVRVDDISIPSPGECFAAINKYDRPAWSQLVRVPASPTTTNRALLALHLGTRVADGFIAVEAQDSQRVKNIGRDIINLAKSLGITQSILARGNSISDFAENNEWNALREELDATENEVKLAMRAQNDSDLVSLVTVGAWLRGTQAACDVVGGQYREDVSQILNQPSVVGLLISKLDALPDRIKQEAIVGTTREGLEQVYAILEGTKGVPVSEPSVESMRTTTSRLVETIAPIAPPTPPAS